MACKATIHFDGNCLLCRRTVRFILRFDKDKRYCFTIQEEAHGVKQHDNSSAIRSGGSVLLHENGLIYSESTASLRILIGLGYPWKVFGVFLLVPKSVRDWVYRLISVNRYRWFGRSDSCFVPEDSQADRFK